MTDEFIENNTMFGTNGIINRRNFIANYIIALIVCGAVYTTPMLYLMFLNPDVMMSAMKISTHGTMMHLPVWAVIWQSVTVLISVVLLLPSVIKRVRDISGEVENNNIVMLCTVLLLLKCVPFHAKGLYIPEQITAGISFFVILYLICVKGGISGEKPKNEIAKFNWGAMFGTWIWGLINRSYAALWGIPLFFTCSFVPFMILCGIKGNEWAYSKLEDKPAADFHKEQSTQTAWFSTLIPIASIIGFLAVCIIGGTAIFNYFDKNPAALKKLESYSAQMIIATTEGNYDKIEITNDEYKFYMNPAAWKDLPEKGKKNLFTTTESYIFIKYPEKFGKTKYAKRDEILRESNKIKIYSTFNNELLAGRNVNIDEYKKAEERYKNKEIPFSEVLKILNSGYGFNKCPTLP